jgi:GT2 family glycosyltransferase
VSAHFVVAGCPARQRAWVLPAWLAALGGQARRPEAVFVLVNVSDDGSEGLGEIGGTYPILPPREGRAVTVSWSRRDDPDSWSGDRMFTVSKPIVERYDTGHPHYERGSGYTVDHHANLASVRNRWIERALAQWPQATHLWMVDSDVLPEPDCRELLLAADKDVVAAPVRNGENAWNFMRLSDLSTSEPRRSPADEMALSQETPAAVTLLGACTLVRRAVLDTWVGVDPAVGVDVPHQPPQPLVRFASHPRGEDLAFCAAARAAGYQLWVEPRARCAHWMDPDKEPLR